MDEALGLRERKKLRTRATLMEVALRLFEEQGYEQTTVAEIAAAADISARTFFSYFPSKEGVVFRDDAPKMTRMTALLRAQAPTTPMVDTLVHAVGEMVAEAQEDREELFLLAPAIMRVVLAEPALQAAGLQRVQRTQRLIVDELDELYPAVDRLDVSICVGALFGALHAAYVAALRRGDKPDDVLAAVSRAIDAAVRGLRAAFGG